MAFKTSHPLRWPAHLSRSQSFERGVNTGFNSNMSLADAVQFLQEEVEALGAESALLLTDYENLMSERLIRKAGSDTGAVLKLTIDRQDYDLACDRWLSLEHNIYALHLALRSWRNMATNWGIADYARLLAGFTHNGTAHVGGNQAVANSGDAQAEEWRSLLGLGPTATVEDAQAVYRRRAKIAADNPEELMRLNLAMDAARKALGG